MLFARLLGCNWGWGVKQALLLEGTDSLRANLQLHLAAVNDNGLLLEVGFPNLLGVALRKADVVSELLALACDFTLAHYIIPSVLGVYFSGFYLLSQYSKGRLQE